MGADRPPGARRIRRRQDSRRRRGALVLPVAILAAPLLLLRPAPAAAAPDVLLHASAPSEYLALGMTLSAKRAFLALPAAERAKSPLLPDILAKLSAAGHDAEALSLFAAVEPGLSGQARARACFAVGKIHWRLKAYGKAAAAFREAAKAPAAAPDAALYLARREAADGNAAGALRTLAAAPRGEKRDGVAAAVEAARKQPGAAALRARAAAAKPGTSAHAASSAALARALLEEGDSRGALAAAREAVAGIAARRKAAALPPAWSGARAGADEAWAAMHALFPDDADAGAFLAAGRAFLAAADLADTARAAGNGARDISRRAEWARRELLRVRGEIETRTRHAGDVRNFYQARDDAATRIRSRAREAAAAVSISAWGAEKDPSGAALLDRLDRALAALTQQAARTREAVDAAVRAEAARALPPEDRRMLAFAREKVDHADEEFRAFEGRAAFLRGRIRNRWKAMYAERVSALFDGADRAREAARDGIGRANDIAAPLVAARAELERWEAAAGRHAGRLRADGEALAAVRARALNAARRALDDAGRELAQAVAREERSARYLAARAATEVLIAEKGDGPAGNAGSRATLLAEARGHWEASLPPAGDRSAAADEATYALAEIGFEEAEARQYAAQEAGDGRGADFTAPAALFRRVIDGFPQSPYAEPAHYGLALCWQEMGASDNSAAVLSAMIARYPASRYADEIHLRLGENAFEQGEFRLAEEEYRKVGSSAPPAVRTTALFKLGWSLFLTERTGESADAFLSALLAAPGSGNAGIAGEALKMTARALVDSGSERQAEALLDARGASAHGPALLLAIQGILDAQNRYDDAVRVADRVGAAYPLARERVDAETAAAEALRKAGRADESFTRRGNFHALFGPGSGWQTAPGRSPADVARADTVAEDGLRGAAFHFHVRTRDGAAAAGRAAPPSRDAVLALYDAHAALFPSAAKAGEIAYQRAWLLFEAGRKKEAGAAFESSARRPEAGRGESSWYMAVQCAKDAAALPGAEPPERRAAAVADVIRLCDAYERAFPRGERLSYILLDRARASFTARRFADAARDADRAASLLSAEAGRREALRLSGDARFEAQDFAGAEKAFRGLLAAQPPAAEQREAEKWIGFSMFRRAETLPRGRAGEAAAIFSGIAREFPSLEIAPTALFRAGASGAEAGNTNDAIAAFLAVESRATDAAMARDATRWLASLYEKTGRKADAAERYERLARSEPAGAESGKLFLRAAGLFAQIDEPRARKNLLAVAALPETGATLRVTCLYRAAESARAEGMADEADALYEKTTAAHVEAPQAAPETAGKAYFARAEAKFARYRTLAIVPPLEKTFAAKRAALDAASALYVEALRIGDAETAPAALHRLGEGLEDFRGAILSSPPPRGLSAAEREEYVFLLEEKAAPLEEKAVDAYRRNLRQAVAAGVSSPWVDRSIARLRALRPALFVRKWEYAFPVVPVPDFLGIIVRTGP